MVARGPLPSGGAGRVVIIAAAAWAIALGCGGTEPASRDRTAAAIVRIAGDAQAGIAGVGLPIDPVVEVRDANGTPIANASVRFDVFGGGATSDTTVITGATGRTSVAWILGPVASAANSLRASAGAISTTFAATGSAPVAGTTYFGRNSYVEYIAGNIPLIISAPHGGVETPA